MKVLNERKIITATKADKRIVVDILCTAFKDDPQINYVLGEGGNKTKRLNRLMTYSFEYCMINGRVMISEDRKSVALWKDKTSNKMNLRLFIESIRFLFTFGFKRLSNISSMDRQIEENYPKEERFDYLWLIGTKPEDQGKGYASALINEGIRKAEADGRSVYLETSTASNLSFYKRKDFVSYGLLRLEGLQPLTIHLLRRA